MYQCHQKYHSGPEMEACILTVFLRSTTKTHCGVVMSKAARVKILHQEEIGLTLDVPAQSRQIALKESVFCSLLLHQSCSHVAVNKEIDHPDVPQTSCWLSMLIIPHWVCPKCGCWTAWSLYPFILQTVLKPS